MVRKPSWPKRIQKAEEELEKEPFKSKEKIREMVLACLNDNNIRGTAILVKPEEIDYETIMNNNQTNGEGHIIWIEFVNKGHVAVVGAGKDIGFPINKNSATAFLLSKFEDIDWDKESLIIVPIRNLDKRSYGIKYVENILQCRNGVEHYIGEYLIEHGVPILNYFSHKNYSDKFWERCKKNNYNLK